MRNWLFILTILLSSSLVSCTGLNILSDQYGSSITGNPTPEYASPAMIRKGGLLYHRNTVPGGIGLHTEGNLVEGEGCVSSYLWMVSQGDASLRTIKKTFEIDAIHSVEYRHEASLGFIFHSFCTKVIGTKVQKNPIREGEG
jgi:hypothetical protein